MSGLVRKFQRKKAKAEGTFIYKKKAAKVLGISVSELNKRLERRERNLREINGGTENGKE